MCIKIAASLSCKWIFVACIKRVLVLKGSINANTCELQGRPRLFQLRLVRPFLRAPGNFAKVEVSV